MSRRGLDHRTLLEMVVNGGKGPGMSMEAAEPVITPDDPLGATSGEDGRMTDRPWDSRPRAEDRRHVPDASAAEFLFPLRCAQPREVDAVFEEIR